MAELAALTGSEPPRSPKAVEGLAGEPGPALGQDPPLALPEGTEQESGPEDGRVKAQSSVDVEPPPGSPPAMATGTGELILELIRNVRAIQAVTEQCCELLQADLAQWRGALGGVGGTCGGTAPGEPSLPPARMEVQVQLGLLGARVWPQCLGAELPWVDADTDKAADGDMETDTGQLQKQL